MRKLNLVYGSVFGSAHYVAVQLQKTFENTGFRAQLLEQPTLVQLNPVYPLLVVTSTTGKGELPERLQPLLRTLQQKTTRDIKGLKYAMIALGDRSYDNYCGGARSLAAALDAAGAIALAPALEIDACQCINPEDEAVPWALKLIEEKT